MAERRSKQSNRKPSFFWQGVLILTPVLVLAKLGAYALWKDQRLAMREAEGQAQELAQHAAILIWDELEKTELPPIRFDGSGNLLFPKPYEEVPVPHPLSETDLNPEQRRLWTAAREAWTRPDNRNTAAFYLEFLKSKPPSAFAAVAHFNRGLALERTGAPAAQEFMAITNQYADTFSEAGLPLDLLARAHLQPDHEFLRYVIENPCPVTPQILKQSSAAANSSIDVSALWAQHEQLRYLAELARPFFRTNQTAGVIFTNLAAAMEPQVDTPSLFWVTNSDVQIAANEKKDASGSNVVQTARSPAIALLGSNFLTGTNVAATLPEAEPSWLLIRVLTARDSPDATGGFILLAQSAQAVSATLRRTIQTLNKPDWLDFAVNVGGRDVIRSMDLYQLLYVKGGKGSGQFWQRTSVASDLPVMGVGHRSERGQPGIAVAAVLISRDMLLFQQQQRALWFGFLIAAAAAASIVGFISAYRAFHKQHRLAEMKSNFVSSVSHELRAPIASIRLMAEGLERGKISESGKQHDYFRFMVQECRRLSSMIENVLDFARIEQGRKQYEFEPVDVIALVHQAVKLMEPYAAERGVRLAIKAGDPAEVSIDVEPGEVASFSPLSSRGEEGPLIALTANIDGAAIQQALVNLIDNAIKHSREGEEVLLTLRSGSISESSPSPLNRERAGVRGEPISTPASNYFCISVEDHGPGIPAAEHEKIFERFYRLGSELRRETPGVGIGLSIVKHVVEAHRGSIQVESEVGKGSRFTMKLPLSQQQNKGPRS